MQKTGHFKHTMQISAPTLQTLDAKTGIIGLTKYCAINASPA